MQQTSTTTTSVTGRRRVVVAAVVVLALAAAALAAAGAHGAATQGDAGPWPQWTKDADHTRQADAPGPDDPGLAWWVDVESLTPEDSDEPYDDLRRYPSLSPEGDVLVRAQHPDDPDTWHVQERLLALDGGEVQWTVDRVKQGCGQATDPQGRVWVQRVVGDDRDDVVLEAIDPTTGDVTASGAPGAFVCGQTPTHLQIGGDPEHLVVLSPRGLGYGADPGLAAYDVSGESAQEAWRFTAEDRDFTNLLHFHRDSASRHAQALVDEGSVYVALEVEEGDDNRPELVEIDLASGEVLDRLGVPVNLDEADHDEPRAPDVGAVNYVRDGGMLMLSVQTRRLSDARGLLAGIDLSTGLDEIAWQVPTGVDGEFTRGPRGLTVNDGAVVLRDDDAGFEPLRAFDPSDGERLWTGVQERSYPSTGVGGRVADAAGALYVHAPGEDVERDRGVLAQLDAEGRGQWYVPEASLEQQMGLDEDDLWRDLAVSALSDDRLVVTEDPDASAHDAGRVIALDDSGGLAEPWPEEPDDTDVPDERIGAANRIATSVELSQQFASADTVLLATAEAYPDSLAGAPLATQLGAPILLTVPDGVSAPVIDELQRLEPDRAILLGGEGALGPGVEDGLRVHGIDDIERFDGANRFQTAAQIAVDVQQRTDGDTGSAYVVEGAHADPTRGWPDAVGVSALAAAEGTPILLVTHGDVPQATAQAAELFSDFTIIGGEGAVSEDVADWFRGLDEMSEEDDVTVARVAGDDRFDTSAQVSDRAVAAGVDPSVVYLATGGDWPDSMSAAPVAGATTADLRVRSGVLLLVDGRDLAFSPASANWLETHAADIDSVTAIGGTAAISDKVLVDAQALVE